MSDHQCNDAGTTNQEDDRWEVAKDGTRYLRIEIHLHHDSLQARHHILLHDESPFRFHSGFSSDDAEAGWKQVTQINVSDTDAAVIEETKKEFIDHAKEYWGDLFSASDEIRVVLNGEHLTAHDPDTGIGFGVALFRVVWIDSTREPLLCTLLAQGRIPTWLRTALVDNAVSITEVHRLHH